MEKEYRVESLLSIKQDRKGDSPSGLFYLDKSLFPLVGRRGLAYIPFGGRTGSLVLLEPLCDFRVG